MTCSTHPTIPQDFAIQVAENEGMPPRPKPSNVSPQPAARARRLTGTRKLGPPKTHSAANGFCSGKERSIKPLGKPKRHPLARVFSRLAVLAGLIALLLPLVATIERPGLIFTVFTALTLTAGFLNGVDFPLAAACCLTATKRVDKSTGLVYSTELVGACIGATLASVLLVPIFGITAACWFAALGNGTSFFVILACCRTGKASKRLLFCIGRTLH